MSVLLETSIGDFVLDLYHVKEPEACTNFLKLCKLKRYNDGRFYHIERNFVARACDRDGDESAPGESLYSLADLPAPTKPRENLRTTHAKAGVVSFPHAGNGSQFFLTLANGLDYLDKDHTAFGEVGEGFETLKALSNVQVSYEHRPFRVIRIRHTIVLHDPFSDPDKLPPIPASPPPAQEPPSGYLPSDEEADGGIGMLDEETLREREAAREAQSRAEVLEMIGDLPDADVKPPDNVLFVCRLNPVTEGEDLEIIFSRFGSCRADVVYDSQTGKSLNYAFVEFENAQQCERAFHKMDKALVDDRRIHVDFSQSVSRLWNENRRRKHGKAR